MKPSRSSRKACTATSLAALSTQVAVPPADGRLAGEPQARERVEVGRLERERADLRPGRACARARRRARDGAARRRSGRACPGWPRCASVAPSHRLDERVDDRLRVHDDVDPVVRRAEQPVRLDHLEALVHQRRGVDRDLAAHRPGRVRERLRDGHALQLGAACGRGTGRPRRSASAARPCPAARRRSAGAARSARSRPGSSCAPVASHSAITSSPPTTSDSLLASATSMPSVSATIVGPEAGGADDRVEHEVGAGLGDEPDEPLGPGEHLAVRPRLGGARGGVGVAERDPVARRGRGPARSAPRASARRTGRRARRPPARAPRRRAPACRSSRSSRGSGAASSGDPVWHGVPRRELSLATCAGRPGRRARAGGRGRSRAGRACRRSRSRGARPRARRRTASRRSRGSSGPRPSARAPRARGR